MIEQLLAGRVGGAALQKQLDAAREQAADNRQKAILVGWQNGTAAARMRQGA